MGTSQRPSIPGQTRWKCNLPRHSMRSLIFVVVAIVVVLHRGSDSALTATVLKAQYPYAGAQTPLEITFNSDSAIAQGDKVTVKLPGWTVAHTTAQATDTGCSDNAVFTAASSNSGEADAQLVFTVSGAAEAGSQACKLTTPADNAKAPATAFTMSEAKISTTQTSSTDQAAASFANNTPATLPVATFSATSLAFANEWQKSAAQAVTVTFTNAAEIAQGNTITLKLPNWAVTGNAAPSDQGCGTSTFTVTTANPQTADAQIVFTVASAALTAATACTITTAAATATVPDAAGATAATLALIGGLTAHTIATSQAVTSTLGATVLNIAYPVIGQQSAATFYFKAPFELAAATTIKLTIPSTTFVSGAVTASPTACGTFANPTVANSGETTAALTFIVGGTAIAVDTGCTITMPSTVLKVGGSAVGQNSATYLVDVSDVGAQTTGATQSSIVTSTPTVASAALSNLALVVATTTGSTATSLSLTFDSNIPLAVGDYVMMTLPDWGVSGTTAPTAVGCGTSTFTTVTGMSGTATAYVQFSVATALLDTVTYTSHGYSMGHNCTLTWASGATTPAAAQAANLNTRKLSAVIAAGTDITNTSITTSTATTAAASSGNSTGGTATGTTTITFTGYTYAAGTAATNFGNVVGCAYAKTVSDATTSLTSNMCTASAGPTFTSLTGSSTTNTVSAARRTGSSVAVALKMYHSLLSQTAATAAVTAVGTTLTAINANIAAINTAAGTGFSTAELTATGMTAATWTHSSASVVVPSMMALFSALLLVLMQ